jgi:ABC-type branched-subunit amino acid transport system substrate-binding protein
MYRIGALLPYTGDLASKGAHIERALLMVADILNENGGIHGKKVTIVFADSHGGDAQRSKTAVQQLINDGVIAIIGPEEETSARAIAPLIREANMPLLMPSITAPQLYNSEIDGEKSIFFRLAPSAQSVGCTLARRVSYDDNNRILVLHSGDNYNVNMANTFEQDVLPSSERQVAMVDISDKSVEWIQEVTKLTPQAIALFAFPATAAKVVQDFNNFSSIKTLWYFPPALRDAGFVENIVSEHIEGSTGLSPELPAEFVEPFNDKFTTTWDGEEPFVEAYFYYDALAVIGLAISSAISNGDTQLKELNKYIIEVSISPTGSSIEWDQLSEGVKKLEKPNTYINYDGISSSLDFGSDGDLIQSPYLEFWKIKNSEFESTGDVSRCIGR